MRSYLRHLVFATSLIALTAFGCDRPEEPGEPESTSAMADQAARADFEGKLEVQINALEPAGEYANLELILKNISDSPVDVTRKDYRAAADSGDWFAAREAPDTLTIAPGATEKTTISVAMPAVQLNLLNVGNIGVEVPDVPETSAADSEPTKPSGKGIQRLEIPDDENADGP